MNNIFVITSNIERVGKFFKYYNILNLPTDTKLSVIVDNRKTTHDVSPIEDLCEIHYVTDVIEKVRPMFTNPDIMDKILDFYGVGIKWLTFPYCHRVLGINKVMMMDDDTFLMKPIDHYFDLDYVFYNESALATMTATVERVMANVFKDKIDVRPMAKQPYFSLNSGQLLHTDNEYYFEFLDRAFSKDIYILLIEGLEKYRGRPEYTGNRVMGGGYWCLEQTLYAVYYYYLQEKTDITIHNYKGDMRIQTNKIKPNTKLKSLEKIPNYIHYVARDKSGLYDTYASELDRLLEERNHK